MRSLVLVLLLAALPPPAASAQVAVIPHLGAGRFSEGFLVESGLSLAWDAGLPVVPRLGAAWQFQGAGCAGWCDHGPWILSTGADYRWAGAHVGAGIGTFRQGESTGTGLGPRENHPTWEVRAGVGRRWRWVARYRRVYHPSPQRDEWQVVLSLGRRITLR